LSGERILELSKVKLTALASGFNRSLRWFEDDEPGINPAEAQNV
jgi:hypothetical protein